MCCTTQSEPLTNLTHITANTGGAEQSSEEYGVGNSAACCDANEFFRRTAYIIDENVINEGRIMSFSKDLVIRYLEIVNEEKHKDYCWRFIVTVEEN